MTSSQIQRFNRLLSSLIQNESTVILKKILQNLKIVVEKISFNGTNESDVRLLQKYMDCAEDILSNVLPKGETPIFRSDYFERERIQHARNSFKNDEVSVVPNATQVLEERTNSKLQTMTEPTTSGRSETVPLLNKEIVMNVNVSKDCSRKSCSFATMRLRSRPAVFIIATLAICLGMCAVIFHPNRVSDFAVTIRRCLFDRM